MLRYVFEERDLDGPLNDIEELVCIRVHLPTWGNARKAACTKAPTVELGKI